MRTLTAFLITFTCLASVSSVYAQRSAAERILSFHSDITVNADSTMMVTETIRVLSTGDRIKRGIYRDFPTTYRDRFGTVYRVGFVVAEVLRDGAPESYRLENQSNGIRVYMGKKDYFLPSGEYTYTLVYRTNRQLGFYRDFVEIYWNVTGNGWSFPIDEASAAIELPGVAVRDIRGLDGYTGSRGAKGKNFKTDFDVSGRVIFRTTRPLGENEGLTIVVNWPKGYVSEPTLRMKAGYFIKDNLGAGVGMSGLIIILIYYLSVWRCFGRDPAKGTIIPLYTPPDKISPAAMRYIMKMGYDNKTFTAAVINMAVKKYLTVHESGGVYTLAKTKNEEADLSPEEKAIALNLFDSRESITLLNLNYKSIRAAETNAKISLKRSFEKIYFFTNREYFIPGLVLSVILMILSSVIKAGGMLPIVIFMAIWVTGWTFGVVALLLISVQAWKAFLSAQTHDRPILIGTALVTSLFCIPFLAGEIGGLTVLVAATSVFQAFILAGAVSINFLFHHLLKAPTFRGRREMDQIEGFRMYLSVAEKDRLQYLNPPEKNPELFEQYLPYALALDVEQKWAEKFSQVFARAGESHSDAYTPNWYSGSGWGASGASGFVSNLGSSFSNAVSSSSSPPGSSSGGGGGSSGGGGGGGGGGGW